jgi:hypothetical protein
MTTVASRTAAAGVSAMVPMRGADRFRSGSKGQLKKSGQSDCDGRAITQFRIAIRAFVKPLPGSEAEFVRWWTS